jgi:hypothetical protein
MPSRYYGSSGTSMCSGPSGRRESCGLWRVPTPSRETRDASHPRPLPAGHGGAERVAPKGDGKRRKRGGNDEGSRCADRDRSDRHQRNMPRRRQRRDVLPPGRVHGHMIPRRRSAATLARVVLPPRRSPARAWPPPHNPPAGVSAIRDVAVPRHRGVDRCATRMNKRRPSAAGDRPDVSGLGRAAVREMTVGQIG